jgi:predicted DNA-binding protein (MmcQ/YjbR family)
MTAARTKKTAAATGLDGAETRLKKFAASLPEVREDFPWGHSAFKVGARAKAFLFMATEKGELSLSVKLPHSGLMALSLPFAEPTGYGLGKSGWVTARFKAKGKPPVAVLERWIEESYRAIAPKKVAARLDPPVTPTRAARGAKR